MHVLPSVFKRSVIMISDNRMKSRNLKLIFRIQGRQRFRQRYAGMSMAELLKAVWTSTCHLSGMRLRFHAAAGEELCSFPINERSFHIAF